MGIQELQKDRQIHRETAEKGLNGKPPRSRIFLRHRLRLRPSPNPLLPAATNSLRSLLISARGPGDDDDDDRASNVCCVVLIVVYYQVATLCTTRLFYLSIPFLP